MGRPIGMPKTGGRVKGARNRANMHLMQIAHRNKCNPFEILLHFAKGDWQALGYSSPVVDKGNYEEDVITPLMRLKAALEACKYLHPQKKSIEIEEELTPEEQNFLNMFRERMAEYAAKQVIEDSAPVVGRDHPESQSAEPNQD